MAWIASNQTLKESHKLFDLMASMAWEQPRAVGHLTIFWWWCIDHAEDGDLSKFKPGHLAIAAGLLPTDGDTFVAAMIEAGFIDEEPNLRLHDWWDHFGLFLKARYKSKPQVWMRIEGIYSDKVEEMEEPDRNETSSELGPDLLQTKSGPTPDQVRTNPTPQDKTEQNKTEPKGDKARARSPDQESEGLVTNAVLPPPTLEKVLKQCDAIDLPHWVGEDFFNLWEGRAWYDRDVPVRNWKSLLTTKKNYWISDNRPKERPGKKSNDDNRKNSFSRNGKFNAKRAHLYAGAELKGRSALQ